MSRQKVLTLEEPIEFGSLLITELVFAPFKAKFLRDLDTTEGREMDTAFDLISKLTGQPDSVLDELGVEDFKKANEIVSDFF